MGSNTLRTQLEAVQKAWDSAPAYYKAMGKSYIDPILGLLEAMTERIEALEGGAHGN